MEGIADGIGRLELTDKKQDVISVLQDLDPTIEDIVTISRQGVSQLHVRCDRGWIPLQYAGDGVIRLLQICLALTERPGGLVLVDEIETGLHYSVYGLLWKAIDKLSLQTDSQIIATTHSYELIAAIQDNIDAVEDFSYYRLGKNGSETSAHRFSYAMLDSALNSEMEVR